MQIDPSKSRKTTSSESSVEAVKKDSSKVTEGSSEGSRVKDAQAGAERIPSDVKVVTGLVEKGLSLGVFSTIDRVNVKVLTLTADDFQNPDLLRSNLAESQKKRPEDPDFSRVRIEVELYAKQLTKTDTTAMTLVGATHDHVRRIGGGEEVSYQITGSEYTDISSFLTFIQDPKNAEICTLIEVVSLFDYDPEVCKQLVNLPNLKTLNFKQTAGYVDILDFPKLEELNLGDIEPSKFSNIGPFKGGNALNLKPVKYRVASPKMVVKTAGRGRKGVIPPKPSELADSRQIDSIPSIDKFNQFLSQRADSQKKQPAQQQSTTTTTTTIPSAPSVPEVVKQTSATKTTTAPAPRVPDMVEKTATLPAAGSSSMKQLYAFLILILAAGVAFVANWWNQSENK